MCVFSMVHDHYQPIFPSDPFQPTTQPPILPNPMPVGPAVPGVTTFTWPTETSTAAEREELRKLIAEFREAIEAAKKVDVLTKQPDCADPEKVKLAERVDALEKRLDELTSKGRRKTKRAGKSAEAAR